MLDLTCLHIVPEHVAPSPGAGTRLMVETDYMPRHTYWTNYNYPSRGKTTGPGSIWGGGYMDTHTFYNDDMCLLRATYLHVIYIILCFAKPSSGFHSALIAPVSGSIHDDSFVHRSRYQDDAHDGALCVSKVYPDLLLNVSYPYGPGWLVKPGDGIGFESFRVLELLQDSDDEVSKRLCRFAVSVSSVKKEGSFYQDRLRTNI
jgi:hypothetical protein